MQDVFCSLPRPTTTFSYFFGKIQVANVPHPVKRFEEIAYGGVSLNQVWRFSWSWLGDTAIRKYEWRTRARGGVVVFYFRFRPSRRASSAICINMYSYKSVKSKNRKIPRETGSFHFLISAKKPNWILYNLRIITSHIALRSETAGWTATSRRRRPGTSGPLTGPLRSESRRSK